MITPGFSSGWPWMRLANHCWWKTHTKRFCFCPESGKITPISLCSTAVVPRKTPIVKSISGCCQQRLTLCFVCVIPVVACPALSIPFSSHVSLVEAQDNSPLTAAPSLPLSFVRIIYIYYLRYGWSKLLVFYLQSKRGFSSSSFPNFEDIKIHLGGVNCLKLHLNSIMFSL